MTGVLKGIRVLDMSRFIAGPFCAALLADMGAEVIRLEPPGDTPDKSTGPFSPGGDDLRYCTVTRNKRAITLDVTRREGKALFRRLARACDVIVENFPHSARVKMGLTYPHLRRMNPRLVVVSISAFDMRGANRDRIAFDFIVQAESGFMSFNGFPDDPPTRSQINWIDLGTGQYAAFGAALALMRRGQTGRGSLVEASLMDTAVSYLGYQGVVAEAATGVIRPRIGNNGYYFLGDVLPTRDGRVAIAAIGNPMWRRLAEMIGHTELTSDPRYREDPDRYEHRDTLVPLVQQWLSSRTSEEALSEARRHGVPCGIVRTVADLLRDPSLAAGRMLKDLPLPSGGRLPHAYPALRVNGSRGAVRSGAPRLGQHNAEVYRNLLGMTTADLRRLRKKGIV